IPLVIAGGVRGSGSRAHEAAQLVRRLMRGIDYTFDENFRIAALTDRGIARVEAFFGVRNLFAPAAADVHAAVNVALHAEALLRRDVDYVIKERKIHLVDELKGRVADKRRWPDGIHTAREAKEGLPLTMEGKVLGSITIRG